MTLRMRSNGYRGFNGNFRNMIFLSLIIHLIVISVILMSVSTTTRHLTFGTAYSVQLVGSDAVLPTGNSSGMKDMLRQNEATSPIIIKSKISSIYSTPVKNQETRKVNIEKAVSAIRKKELTKPKTSASASAAGRPAISNAEIEAQTNDYKVTVWFRVKQNYYIPPTLMPEKNITTIIDVKISRSGALEYAGFEKRSGNRYFDDSVLRAVKKSAPFPPLPNWVMENSIEIGIRFNSAELR